MVKNRRHGEGSLFKRKGSPYWYMAYRIDGRQRQVSTKTEDKAVADKLLHDRIGEIKADEDKARRELDDHRLGDLADEWFERLEKLEKPSSKTRRDWQSLFNGHIRPVFGNDYLHEHRSPDPFRNFAAAKLSGISPVSGQPLPTAGQAWKTPLSPQTVKHLLTVLSGLFEFGIDTGRTSTNPIKLVDRPEIDSGGDERPDPMERSEVRALLNALSKRPVHRMAASLQVNLGLRPSEAYGLRRRDWDAKRKFLRIRTPRKSDGSKVYLSDDGGPKTKSGRRSLRLSDRLAAELDQYIAWLDAHYPASELLFPNQRGGLVHHSNFLRDVWGPAKEAAGLRDEITPHQLRHTYASEQIRAGTDPAKLAKRLGHKTPQVTLTVYARAFDDAQAEQADLNLYDEDPETEAADETG